MNKTAQFLPKITVFIISVSLHSWYAVYGTLLRFCSNKYGIRYYLLNILIRFRLSCDRFSCLHCFFVIRIKQKQKLFINCTPNKRILAWLKTTKMAHIKHNRLINEIDSKSKRRTMHVIFDCTLYTALCTGTYNSASNQPVNYNTHMCLCMHTRRVPIHLLLFALTSTRRFFSRLFQPNRHL